MVQEWRVRAKVEKMKTWFVLAGMMGVGFLALFGGSRWFFAESQPEPADALDEAAQFSRLEEIEPGTQPISHSSATTLLELNLPRHQPLDLLKTVEQVLIQKTPAGEQVSRSSLELAVSLRLEETAQDGSQLLSVLYHRVRYHQDIAGRSFVLDSSVPSGQLPIEALPYKGLVGNGFSFWVGKDHRIIHSVGFGEFLKRCVREVPPDRRQRVLLAFSEAAESGVVNFVDDCLEFLPPNPNVGAAETWTREKRLAKPIPLLLGTRFTLNRLTEQFAEIDMEGKISAAPQTSGTGDLQVFARGGRSQGRCQIDRGTGLPLHSETKRFLDMEVKTADGRAFDQQKIITTTIRLVPRPSSSSDRGVVHAGAELPARN
jgi:Family of unknown function (DUF6263)